MQGTGFGMVSPLPDLLTAGEAAKALRQDMDATYEQLRGGLLPAIKTPSGRWRVHRSTIEAILAGQPPLSLAERRAALLGQETLEFLRDLAAAAPALTDEQRDTIRAVFQGGGAS